MASHCLPMPNLILSNLIEFYGPHSNLRTHSKFPFLSCIQIEYMWEARSISILTKSNVQRYCICCYFSSAPPSSIPAYYSRPIDFEITVLASSPPVETSKGQAMNQSHGCSLFKECLEWSWLFHSWVVKGLSQRLNSPRWWGERSQVSLALLTSLRYLSPTS